jgi:hypothetical protein
MALALLSHLKIDQTSRRFVVWMAIGTAFIAALVAIEYFSGNPIF